MIISVEGKGKGLVDEKKGSFVRKGIVGGWTDTFNEEQSDYVDEQVKIKMAKSGIQFQY